MIAKSEESKGFHEQEKAREDIILILSEYRIEKAKEGTELISFLEKKQAAGEIEEVIENNDGTVTIIKDGYEATIKEDILEIIDIGKVGLRPKVENIRIMVDETTEAEEGTVKKGTPLMITFSHSIEGGTTTVTPSVPYTTDGTETEVKFVITGTVEGKPYPRNVVIDISGKYKDIPKAGTVLDTKPEKWTSNKVTPIADGEGGVLPLPNDFYYVGGDISTGIVISDKSGDTIDAEGIEMGNQFVWIPVTSESDLERTNFNSNGQPTTGLSTSNIEPYTSGYSTEVSEYNTMRTQVLKYGGFYIGRFEAGVNTTTLRTGTTTAQKVVSKRGVAPYNYVPWGKSMNDSSEIEGKSGAVYLAKSMYKNSDSITSTLCYGCQWDAMCRYIGDSGRNAAITTKTGITGNIPTDVSKNIYDLAGNCMEWTMEANTDTNCRKRRGGYYNIGHSVSNRSNCLPTDSADFQAFRCTLYIK